MSMRNGWIRRFSIVLICLIFAFSLGAGLARPLFGLPTTITLIICASVAAAWAHPRAATALAVAIPLISEIVSSSSEVGGFSSLLTWGVGYLILSVAIVRMWSAASRRAKGAGFIVVAFGAVTLSLGVLFAQVHQERTQLAISVLYATGIGFAAAISNMRPGLVFALLSTLGAWAALSAGNTPALQTDRTVAVLGENANGIGMIAALGFVAALMGSIYIRGMQKWLYLIGIVTCLWGVYVSASRGAIVICFAGVTVLLIGRWLRGPSVKSIFVSLVASVAVVFLAQQLVNWFADITGRTALGADANFTARGETLSYAIQQGLDHPVFGVGLGQLAAFSEGDSNSHLGQRAHNVYAGVFAELGVPALILMLILCGLAVYHARRYSTGALALVFSVLVAGISLEWWGAGRTGVIAMFILGWAAGLSLEFNGSRRVGYIGPRRLGQDKVYAPKSGQPGQ